MTRDDNSASHPDADIAHCAAKVRSIVEEGRDDRRALLQLGYNLGRLSELTGGGRGPFWDAWKDAVMIWDLEQLGALARDLLLNRGGRRPDAGASSVRTEDLPS